ncbi:expressed unknown protein [Seminavis robusta]|uniref:Uncharacterized protein n=1 Tax=Seminavis robusta TaxID=568900 RepID=A0A9N8EFF5_9STRA|nr:expressed unknown protein [Seminavis robusta]|eukprot:Sro866_g213020.1 n/a (314) ;mRNA; f:23122-24063
MCSATNLPSSSDGSTPSSQRPTLGKKGPSKRSLLSNAETPSSRVSKSKSASSLREPKPESRREALVANKSSSRRSLQRPTLRSAQSSRTLVARKESLRGSLVSTRKSSSQRSLLPTSNAERPSLKSSQSSRSLVARKESLRGSLVSTRKSSSQRSLLPTSNTERPSLKSSQSSRSLVAPKGSLRDSLVDTRRISSERSLNARSVSLREVLSNEDNKKESPKKKDDRVYGHKAPSHKRCLGLKPSTGGDGIFLDAGVSEQKKKVKSKRSTKELKNPTRLALASFAEGFDKKKSKSSAGKRGTGSSKGKRAAPTA